MIVEIVGSHKSFVAYVSFQQIKEHFIKVWQDFPFGNTHLCLTHTKVFPATFLWVTYPVINDSKIINVKTINGTVMRIGTDIWTKI